MIFSKPKTLVLLAIIFSAVSTVHTQEVLDRIIAVVNDEPIFQSELQQAFSQKFPNNIQQRMSQEDYTRAHNEILRILINDKLIMQYVQNNISASRREQIRNYVNEQVQERIEQMQSQYDSPQELLQQERANGMTWEELRSNLQKAYYREHLTRYVVPQMSRERVGEITEEDIAAFKDENPDYQESGSIQIAHILISVPDDATKEEMQAKRGLALEIMEQARSGVEFAELVQEYSDHEPSVPSGGRLPAFQKGELYSEFDILFDMQSGTVTEPIKTKLGYHVVKILQKNTIKDEIFQSRWQDATKEWLDELKEKAVIKIRQGDEFYRMKNS